MTANIYESAETTSGPIAASSSTVNVNSGVSMKRDYFTDHSLTELKVRTVSSGLVTISAQAVQFVLSLAAVVVLARLLTPRDFGLVAMVTVVTGFLQIFNDAGLSTATIQREGITHAQVSNLFWANVSLGGLITLLVAASAPAIAWFYNEPRLVGITLALSATFILTSATVQHMALLKRRMDFKRIAIIQLGALMVGVLVGVGMALWGFGYWSAVGMQLSIPSISLFLTWWASDWRPQRPMRSSGTGSLLGFGANLTVSSLLWSLSRGLDGLLIGRFYGPESLGLYSRAGALLTRPMDQLVGPVAAVLVPSLSRLQGDPKRYRRVALQVFEATAVCTFFFTGLLLPVAHPLTIVVLGPKWVEAAPIFAGFTLMALYTPVASVASWLLMSQGRGRDLLVQCLIASPLAIVSWVIGLPFGPVGVAASYSAFCLLASLPLTYYIAGRQGPVSTRDLWGGFFRHLPVWGVVCGSSLLVRQSLLAMSPFTQLIICSITGLLMGAVFISVYAPSRRAALSLVIALAEWRKARGF